MTRSSVLLLLCALFAVALANTRLPRPPPTTTTHRPVVPAQKQYLLTTSGSCGAKLSLICKDGRPGKGQSLSSVILSSAVSSGSKSSVSIKLQEIKSLASNPGASRD